MQLLTLSTLDPHNFFSSATSRSSTQQTPQTRNEQSKHDLLCKRYFTVTEHHYTSYAVTHYTCVLPISPTPPSTPASSRIPKTFQLEQKLASGTAVERQHPSVEFPWLILDAWGTRPNTTLPYRPITRQRSCGRTRTINATMLILIASARAIALKLG